VKRSGVIIEGKIRDGRTGMLNTHLTNLEGGTRERTSSISRGTGLDEGFSMK
jgi:hypothetical protein